MRALRLLVRLPRGRGGSAVMAQSCRYASAALSGTSWKYMVSRCHGPSCAISDPKVRSCTSPGPRRWMLSATRRSRAGTSLVLPFWVCLREVPDRPRLRAVHIAHDRHGLREMRLRGRPTLCVQRPRGRGRTQLRLRSCVCSFHLASIGMLSTGSCVGGPTRSSRAPTCRLPRRLMTWRPHGSPCRPAYRSSARAGRAA